MRSILGIDSGETCPTCLGRILIGSSNNIYCENWKKGCKLNPNVHARIKSSLGLPCNKCGSAQHWVSQSGRLRCRNCSYHYVTDCKYKAPRRFYVDMWNAQSGLCATCYDFKPLKGPNKLQVDHDHRRIEGIKKWNLVRLLLCNGCNKFLGAYNDNIVPMEKAATYVDEGLLYVVPEVPDCQDCVYTAFTLSIKIYRYCNKHIVPKNKWLVSNYGISIDHYYAMYDEQKGRCKICDKFCPRHSDVRDVLYVDHDKELKIIRGLLCRRCNLAIGHAKHNSGIIRNLKEYVIYFTDKIDRIVML